MEVRSTIMINERKLSKSEVLAALENDDRRAKAEKAFASKVTSCFKCSKASPTEEILDQNDIRQYMDDRVEFVHDQKFNCDILNHKKKRFVLNCTSGDKKSPQKCSTCAPARNELTVEYINLNITKERVSEMRIVYRCAKHNEKGHYYRASFSCDEYKEK